MATEFWYRDGGTWRKAKEIHYKDSSVWRKLKELWYRDGGVWCKVYSGFTPGLTGGGALYIHGEDGHATCSLTVKTNGILTITGDGSTDFQWGSPTTVGVGSGYWVRFTVTASSNSGSGGTATFTASTGWLQLSSDRTAFVDATKVSGSGTRVSNATYTVEIATDSGGANIVAIATGYSLRATAVMIL
jgi:hypothetical protein